MIIIKGNKRITVDTKLLKEKAKLLRQQISKLEDLLHPDWSVLDLEGSAQCDFLLRSFDEHKPKIKLLKEAKKTELNNLFSVNYLMSTDPNNLKDEIEVLRDKISLYIELGY